MKPDDRFLRQPKSFWADVRLIGEQCGYTVRGKGLIKVPDLNQITAAYESIGLGTQHIIDAYGSLNDRGRLLLDYFQFRADKLNREAEPKLMDADRAKKLYQKMTKRLKPSCPIPMNKQKGAKKAPAYLTALINMMVESNAAGFGCDYDPRNLTTITDAGAPVRTLSRRVDGCFPSTVNPIAIWEIKEYYYTTTFGSRVADGVYESLLDGLELEELRESENIDVKHYLMVDAHYTWWKCGKSYLCRIFDMLHMGYVDEVLFGAEVVDRLPGLVAEWVDLARSKGIKPNTENQNLD